MSKGNTHKIIPIKPLKFIRILETFGFTLKSLNGGSHIKMTKTGIIRPIVNHGDLRVFDIKSMLKTAEITEKAYLEKFNLL